VDCKQFETKDGCFSYPECVWTPPTEDEAYNASNDRVAGCCPQDKPEYDPIYNTCIEGLAGICDHAWTATTAIWIQDGTIPKEEIVPNYIRKDPESQKYQYCAQVCSDTTFGIWYDLEQYPF
jgi:hypothetical protein